MEHNVSGYAWPITFRDANRVPRRNTWHITYAFWNGCVMQGREYNCSMIARLTMWSVQQRMDSGECAYLSSATLFKNTYPLQ